MDIPLLYSSPAVSAPYVFMQRGRQTYVYTCVHMNSSTSMYTYVGTNVSLRRTPIHSPIHCPVQTEIHGSTYTHLHINRYAIYTDIQIARTYVSRRTHRDTHVQLRIYSDMRDVSLCQGYYVCVRHLPTWSEVFFMSEATHYVLYVSAEWLPLAEENRLQSSFRVSVPLARLSLGVSCSPVTAGKGLSYRHAIPIRA